MTSTIFIISFYLLHYENTCLGQSRILIQINIMLNQCHSFVRVACKVISQILLLNIKCYLKTDTSLLCHIFCSAL